MPAQDYTGGFFSADGRIHGCCGDMPEILKEAADSKCDQDVLIVAHSIADLRKVTDRIGCGGTFWYFNGRH